MIVALNFAWGTVGLGFKALADNRHRNVLKSCRAAIGGGVGDRSPGVDLGTFDGRQGAVEPMRDRFDRAI